MLPDFRLETFFSKWEFSARYNIGGSDAESTAVAELLETADDDDRRSWEELRLGYTETFGAPRLREAIAATYDSVSPTDVLTFAGAEEGIFAAMQVLLTRQDHAIVITPNYQSAETIPMSICDVSGIALDPDNDWNLDLDRVRDAIRDNTRMISINFPHNPTGKVISRADFDALVSIAQDHDLYLFSDEVYRLLERKKAMRLPQMADAYPKGLSLNVMSKAYGLPGLRIGWIACHDQSLLSRMERVKHYLSICNSAPSEVLATIALKAANRIVARNRKIIDVNLAKLDEFFGAHTELFEWSTPDGGCIGYPRYLGADGIEAFASRLVEESGVLLLPASVYRSALGPTPGDRFRIGYGRRDMPEGLDVMRAFIERKAA